MSAEQEEKALVLFQEMEVPSSLQVRILDLEPDFAKLPEEEQREMLGYMLEQAAKTQEGVKSRFPEISIKHAGTVAFEMPKEVGEEDGKLVREFVCIILDQYLTKAYWKENYGSGGRGVPDCASVDAFNPYTKDPISSPKDGGCIACPMNRFGSGVDERGQPTRGKACRDTKRLVVHVEGHALPIRVMISASNIKAFDGYMNDLRDQGLPIGSVVTRFRAVEATSRGGQDYTGLELTTIKQLNWTEMKGLKRNVVDPFKPDFRLGAIETFDDGDAPRAPSEGEQKGQRQKAADVMD